MKSSVFNWCRNLGLAALLAFVTLFIGTGCELNDSGEDDGGGKGNHLGIWALYPGTAPQGTIAWYIRFKSNGTFKISDNPDGSGERVSGTWIRFGDNITGPFTNPGVGDGRIDCVVNSGVLVMDFVEYWHTPHKLVPYAGARP